jgi:hypothetical protein
VDRPPFVAAVDLEQLVAKATGPEASILQKDVGEGGVSCLLARQADQWRDSIRIGVFAGRAEAQVAQRRTIDMVSAGPTDRLDGSIGNGVVACWKSQASYRLLWTRDNVLVDLCARTPGAFSVAKYIDQALADGRHGAHRGAVVPVPEIVEISVPEDAKPDTETILTIRIKLPAGANGDILALTGGTGVPQEGLGLLVSPNASSPELIYRIPYRFRVAQKDAWVTYATSGCVVVSRKLPQIGK